MININKKLNKEREKKEDTQNNGLINGKNTYYKHI